MNVGNRNITLDKMRKVIRQQNMPIYVARKDVWHGIGWQLQIQREGLEMHGANTVDIVLQVHGLQFLFGILVIKRITPFRPTRRLAIWKLVDRHIWERRTAVNHAAAHTLSPATVKYSEMFKKQ